MFQRSWVCGPEGNGYVAREWGVGIYLNMMEQGGVWRMLWLGLWHGFKERESICLRGGETHEKWVPLPSVQLGSQRDGVSQELHP